MASTADRARCIYETTVNALAHNLKATSAGPQAVRLHSLPRLRRRPGLRRSRQPIANLSVTGRNTNA
jgi:hypothetical protein